MADTPLHIVVFPWLAFGHMIPFLELSKSLARRGHLVSFLTTQRNLGRLPAVPPHLSHLLRLVPLPLQRSPSLPASAEATSDIPSDQIHHLKKSYDALDVHIASFLRSATPPPDWIVHDIIIPYSLPSLAATFGIPCVFFSTFPAWILGFHGSPEVLKSPSSGEDAEWLTSRPDWVPFPTAISYRPHEARKMAAFYTDASSGITDSFRIATAADGCDLLAFRSSAEFEPQWLGLVGEIYKKPVIPVGLFPPSVQERDDDHTATNTEIFEWLCNQKAGSVIYAALGTEAPLSIEFMHELALGLELADLPCIWAVRKPPTSDTDVLPLGFLDRIAAKGKLQVVMGWVPQLKILSHQAVGGFLTHCGWNSIVEGLGLGLPLVLLPVALDQGLNARAMVEKGVGVEVERREDDGFFTREAVSRAVRAVMAEGEGKEIRRKARQMGNVLGDRDGHQRCMGEFVKCLSNSRRKEEVVSTHHTSI